MKASGKLNRLLTPEFRLVAACSWLDEPCWPAQRDLVLQILQSGVCAEEFLALVKRHRVTALAHAVLTRAAADAAVDVSWVRRLQPVARQSQMQSLRLHAEWLRISKWCLDANICARTLKGPGLSARLYRNVGLRHTRDLDLLVKPGDRERLLDVLEAGGYTVDRGFAPHRRHSLAFRIARSLEYHTACRSGDGLIVEVHSHLERPLNSRMDEPWTELAWAAEESTQALFDFLYCTLHGCLHGWSRLKWLGDLRVMAGRITEEQWPDLIRHAEELRVHTLLGETLFLLKWITGLTLPNAAEALVKRAGKPAHRLASQAIGWMAKPEPHLHGIRLADKVHQWQLGWQVGRRLPMGERMSYWLSQTLFSSADMREVELPGWLTGLYAVIRPLAFISRTMQRRIL